MAKLRDDEVTMSAFAARKSSPAIGSGETHCLPGRGGFAARTDLDQGEVLTNRLGRSG